MPKAKSTKKESADASSGEPRRLTAKEVDLVLKDEATFAEYLVTLSLDQIDAYLALLEKDKEMEEASRSSFIALLKEVRAGRAEADRQAALKIAPLLSNALYMEEVDRQIDMLEQIQKEASSSAS